MNDWQIHLLNQFRINSSKVYCKYDKIILKHSTITVLIAAKCIVNIASAPLSNEDT